MHAEVEIAGEIMHLLPERAMHWPARSTLLIADTHFGKDAAFRHAGVPVPQESLHADLGRLTSLVRGTGCERLVVLGDFYHTRSGRSEHTETQLDAWFAAHASLDVVVIEGNHDEHAGPPRPEWRVWFEPGPLREPPFAFVHDPAEAVDSPSYRVCGHLHPVVNLRGPARSSRRVPCFAIARNHAILPAFGGFTGGRAMRAAAGLALHPVVDGAVVPPAPAGMTARQSR